MSSDKKAPSTPVARARQKYEARQVAKHDGTSGRVREDARAPFGVEVDLVVRPDDIRTSEHIVETLPALYLNDLLGGKVGAQVGFWTESDAAIDLTLDGDGVAGLLRITGTIGAQVVHSCVRCLNPVRFPLNLDVSLRALAGNDELFAGEAAVLDPQGLGGGEDEYDDDAMTVNDDEDFITYQKGKLDLSRMIREQIFLELPAHPRCDSDGAETDGPCLFDAEGKAKAEADRWQDPRWDALRALSDKMKN